LQSGIERGIEVSAAEHIYRWDAGFMNFANFLEWEAEATATAGGI